MDFKGSCGWPGPSAHSPLSMTTVDTSPFCRHSASLWQAARARTLGTSVPRMWRAPSHVDGPRHSVVKRSLPFRIHPTRHLVDETRHPPLLERGAPSADPGQSRTVPWRASVPAVDRRGVSRDLQVSARTLSLGTQPRATPRIPSPCARPHRSGCRALGRSNRIIRLGVSKWLEGIESRLSGQSRRLGRASQIAQALPENASVSSASENEPTSIIARPSFASSTSLTTDPCSSIVGSLLTFLLPNCKGCPETFCKGCVETGHPSFGSNLGLPKSSHHVRSSLSTTVSSVNPVFRVFLSSFPP